MKHTKRQAVRAKNKLIKIFGYRPSDFLETEKDWLCINTEDCEISAFDIFNHKMSEL